MASLRDDATVPGFGDHRVAVLEPLERVGFDAKHKGWQVPLRTKAPVFSRPEREPRSLTDPIPG